jgi:hypothetical protein
MPWRAGATIAELAAPPLQEPATVLPRTAGIAHPDAAYLSSESRDLRADRGARRAPAQLPSPVHGDLDDGRGRPMPRLVDRRPISCAIEGW